MNIVIINNFWRYPNTDRWDFDMVVYKDFVCHKTNHISYVVNERGKLAITATEDECDVYQVANIYDFAELKKVLIKVEQKHGKIDRIVAFSENLLSPAAALRESFGVPGPTADEVHIARNKLRMKELIHQGGLRAPRYRGVSQDDDIRECIRFADAVGYPLILKPTEGASSQGVCRVADETQLRAALHKVDNDRWELEEFVTGDIYHVDGIVDQDGEVLLCVASQYVNPCLEFSFETPLGAVMLPYESALNQRIVAFTGQCLSALKFKSCPFHLELFRTPNDELVFLEVGARVGGADVPSMIQHETGVNLFEHWSNLALFGKTQITAEKKRYGAWIMFGLPHELPSRVVAITDLKQSIPSLYRQFIPRVNDTLVREGGYCSLQSGRFLLSNTSHDQLVDDVKRLLSEFFIETVACEEAA